MAASGEDLPAVQKAYDICRWLIPVVARLPREHRFTFGDRLESTALDLVLALVEAGHVRAKDRPLYRASRLLDQLRILLRLACDIELISTKRHRFASEQMHELGRMIGGWMKHARVAPVPLAES